MTQEEIEAEIKRNLDRRVSTLLDQLNTYFRLCSDESPFDTVAKVRALVSLLVPEIALKAIHANRPMVEELNKVVTIMRLSAEECYEAVRQAYEDSAS